MLIEHEGKRPAVDPEAWVAPDATLCGDVEIGPGCRVMHGARIIAEAGSTIRLGARVIVMENAVIRAGRRHPCRIGDHCLVGPGAHIVGAEIEDEVFLATGVSVFHGARIGRGSGVRVKATVHLRTRLEPGSVVPIGWVAIGDPAQILPPDRHDAIWAVQQPLDFYDWVYGVPRGTPGLMVEVTGRLAQSLGAHGADRVVEG